MAARGTSPSIVDGKKRCSICEIWKPVSEFKKMERPNRPGVTYYPQCDPCRKEYHKNYYRTRKEEDPEFLDRTRKINKRSTLKKHGLTEDDWDQMVAGQNGKCAICDKAPGATLGVDKNRLVIDHDHTTGKVRALLCDFCNRGIGMFFEDPGLLIAAAEYVQQFEGGGQSSCLG